MKDGNIVFWIPTKARGSSVHQSEKSGSRDHPDHLGGPIPQRWNWSVRLTTHLYLVKKTRIHGATTTPSYAFMACPGTSIFWLYESQK